MLVRSEDGEKLTVGTSLDAELSSIGRARARIVGRSSLGLHVEFTSLEADAESALRERSALGDPRGEPDHSSIARWTPPRWRRWRWKKP